MAMGGRPMARATSLIALIETQAAQLLGVPGFARPLPCPVSLRRLANTFVDATRAANNVSPLDAAFNRSPAACSWHQSRRPIFKSSITSRLVLVTYTRRGEIMT